MSQNKETAAILYARGFGICGQVLAEFIAYFLLMAGTVLLFVLTGIGTLNIMDLEIPAFSVVQHKGFFYTNGEILIRFFVGLIPIMLMTAAFHRFLYEITEGIVAGVLTHFLVTVAMGYVCGCFYPISYFPPVIQKIAGFLPMGTALFYLRGFISYRVNVLYFAGVIMYFVFFILATVAIRMRKIRIGK